MTLLAHKIALKPNNKQRAYFRQASGVARFAYNWALEEWKRQYEEGGKPSAYKINKQLNAIKREQFPWMLNVTKNAAEKSVHDLGDSFSRFFKGQNKYPKFKKKGVSDSFRADTGGRKGVDAAKIDGKRIKLAKIGWVNMHEELRLNGRIKTVVVSRRADRWFASVLVDVDELPNRRKKKGVVGVDLGVKHLAVTSDGLTVNGPKPIKKALVRLRRLSKELSRREKGSNRWRKTRAKLAKAHYRIACIRKDSLHKLTTELVLNYTVIGIEDLNVSGMVRNRKLSRAIRDMGWGEFRRQIEYKAELYGSSVVLIPRFNPSTKTCCECGEIHDMPLHKRVMRCDCGNVRDRDVNAAINIRNYAARYAVTSDRGDNGSGLIEVQSSETMSEKR